METSILYSIACSRNVHISNQNSFKLKKYKMQNLKNVPWNRSWTSDLGISTTCFWYFPTVSRSTNWAPLLVQEIFLSHSRINSFKLNKYKMQNVKNSFEPELNQWPRDINNMLLVFSYSPPIYQLSYRKIVGWWVLQPEDKYSLDVVLFFL